MAPSVSEAAKSGDVRATYEAMRDKLATDLDGADPAIAAQISGQLRQVLKDLQAMPSAKGVPKRDDLRKRREARRVAASTPEPDPAKGGVKRGG